MSRLERELELSVAYLERAKMNERALAVAQSQELAREQDVDADIGLSVDNLIAHVTKVHAVQRRVMKEGHHYGTVPGAGDRKCLLKPGAELLTLTFKLDPQFLVADRWDGEHLESLVTCTLFHAPTGNRLGSGVGSCSTRESKYAWRKAERICPKCGTAAIIKGKADYGGGWLCFARKGGCGAKFPDKDSTITGQQTGRVANPDIADVYNTVRKMACKRAHVAAVLFITGASEIFTQDLDDEDEERPDRADGGYGDAPRGHDMPTRRTPDISPHGVDSDMSERELSELVDPQELMDMLIKAERLLEAGSWASARGIIGAKGGSPGEFGPVFSVVKNAGKLSAAYSKDLGKLWGNLDRRIAKLEKADLEKPADVLDSLTDPEDFQR